MCKVILLTGVGCSAVECLLVVRIYLLKYISSRLYLIVKRYDSSLKDNSNTVMFFK